MSLALLLGVTAWLPRARFPQTTTEPATAWMRDALGLLERQAPWAVAAWLLAVVLLVLATLRWRARGRSTVEPEGAATAAPRHPARVLWTLAPVALVALVVTPAVWPRLAPSAPAADPLAVRVIGHQWWWEIRYPGTDVVTATDLHVPLGRAVEVTLESADVAHSLWVPAVAPRQEVQPLRRRVFTFTPDRAGVFPGQCGELCGASHAHMHLKLFVDSPPAFAEWVAAQQAERVEPDSVSGGALWAGRQIFVAHSCRGCHTVRGLTDGPIGPDLTHFASRTTIGGGMFERTDDHLGEWILHANTVKPGSTMPGSPVPPRQLGALVVWLQSLR